MSDARYCCACHAQDDIAKPLIKCLDCDNSFCPDCLTDGLCPTCSVAHEIKGHATIVPQPIPCGFKTCDRPMARVHDISFTLAIAGTMHDLVARIPLCAEHEIFLMDTSMPLDNNVVRPQ